MSVILVDPTAAFSRCRPVESTNTMASPVGLPHDSVVGSAEPGGLVARLPTPLTASPPSATRSARGPHRNGPGSGASNRHVSPAPSGAAAQARPCATKATVASAPGEDSAHATGSEVMSEAGPEGLAVDMVGVGEAPLLAGWGGPPEHAAARRARHTAGRLRRGSPNMGHISRRVTVQIRSGVCALWSSSSRDLGVTSYTTRPDPAPGSRAAPPRWGVE